MKIEVTFIWIVFLAVAESADPQIRYAYRNLTKAEKISLEETATGDSEFHLEFPVSAQDLETTSLKITRYHVT